MKIWSGIVITAGIALVALAVMSPSGEGIIAGTVLISGGSVAMSISCLCPKRQTGTEKRPEE
jgi:hypothetical protein